MERGDASFGNVAELDGECRGGDKARWAGADFGDGLDMPSVEGLGGESSQDEKLSAGLVRPGILELPPLVSSSVDVFGTLGFGGSANSKSSSQFSAVLRRVCRV